METQSQSSNNSSSTQLIERDGNHQSAWQAEAIAPLVHPQIQPGTLHDVVIIGGGITGITAGLLLQNAGKKCLLVEMNSIGYGTTGGTTSHVNTFADTSYSEAESAFGEDGAQLFADAVNEGLNIIKSNVGTYQIDCDLETKEGYIYAEDEEQAKQLDDLYNGTIKVGVDIDFIDNVPTPVQYLKAVVLPNQAQFHPLKYLKGLEQAFLKAGGLILENTRVDDIEHQDDIHLVKAGDQILKAQKVVYATHLPPKITVFSFTCAPYRSYAIAVRLAADNYPDALIYDMQDPYHYTRTHVINGQKLLIVGGNDHKTGHDDPGQAFADLEKYVQQYYKVSEVAYKWSSQYYVPADGFPYIGQLPFDADGIYCATGYNGNGMMLGTISAKILSDIILGNKSKYEEVFSTSRIKPIDGFKEFVKENADVAYHFIADRFSIKEEESLNNLQNDSGKVVEIDGKKIAAYKDKQGVVHALNPVCTHAYCIVNWNQEEKSWDCPCHGARYDINGTVITGPAVENLPKIEM